jgi:HD-GYP domain-containing protein (c-di-GMP phosphodiesterase class II)
MQQDAKEAVRQFIMKFLSALQARLIYGAGHRITKAAADDCHALLAGILSARDDLTIGVIGNELAFGKEPYYGMPKNAEDLIAELTAFGVEKISFLKGVGKDELVSFLDILASGQKPSGDVKDINRSAEKAGLVNIAFGRLGLGEETEEEKKDAYLAARERFEEGLDFLKRVSEDVCGNKPLDPKAARLFVDRIITNLLKNRSSLLVLTSLKKRDEATFVHSINVAILSLVEAEALGLGRDEMADIGIAGMLHDTGKIAVEGEILRKKGALTAEELKHIRTHPIDGAKILLGSPDISPVTAIASFEHHIRYDRKGYPERLFGKRLNLASMIIAIADEYDALRSKRAYHEEMVPERVYEEMRKLSGEHFHPFLLELFFRTIGVYPPGTLVELDDQTVGLVVKEGALDIKRPQVEILYDSKGGKAKEPYTVNLLEKDEKTSRYKRSIAKSLPFTDKFPLPAKYEGEGQATFSEKN